MELAPKRRSKSPRRALGSPIPSRRGSHPSTRLPSLSPELGAAADGLRAAQLRVQVVIDASHLSDSDPVLALQRQTERAPAHVGGHVQNEAGHAGKLDAANIPGRTGESVCSRERKGAGRDLWESSKAGEDTGGPPGQQCVTQLGFGFCSGQDRHTPEDPFSFQGI